MKKKIFGLVMACMMLVSATANARWYEDKEYDDRLNNDLYEVVAELHEGTPAEGSFVIDRIYMVSELKGNGFETRFFEVYSDGTFGQEIPGIRAVDEREKALGEIDSGELLDENDAVIYNDGHTCGYIDEEFDLRSVVMDADDNVVYNGLSAGGIYYFDYNLGYAVESSPYENNVYNVATGEEFWFENCWMETFGNDGYAILYAYNGAMSLAREDAAYLIKLKKPAIMTVYLDGKKIGFDRLPVSEEGRMLVPLRAIFEALGAEIAWDGNTQTVTAVKDGTTISLTLGDKNATKNGETIELEVPAKSVGGRTFVPVRFIADSFGVEVGWNDSMKQVILTSAK